MRSLVSTILVFSAIVCVGALLRRFRAVDDDDANGINAVIVYVGLPAFILRAVHGAELGHELLGVVAVSWAAFAMAFGVAWAVERLLHLPRATAGAFLLAAIVGNTGYLGYPLTQSLLGHDALPYAVFSDVFGTVVALVFFGLPLARRMGGAPSGELNVVKELATFPAVVALFAGLLLRPVTFPASVEFGLDTLASMVAPLIMLSVGMALRPRSVLHDAVPLAVLGLIRLLVGPLVAFGAGSLLLDGEALRVAVMQAGMPSMMLSLAVGRRFGLDNDFIASAILVTTLASAVSIPVVQALAF